MSSVVISFAAFGRPGATPVQTIVHHRGWRSVIQFIDPRGQHEIPVTAKEALDFEATLKRRVGDEPRVIVELLERKAVRRPTEGQSK